MIIGVSSPLVSKLGYRALYNLARHETTPKYLDVYLGKAMASAAFKVIDDSIGPFMS